MIRPLLRMGHPLLRQEARPLSREEILSPSFQDLLQDMRESMEHHGGIGLAAPQIGESIQLAVIELEGGVNRYGSDEGLGFTVFINPQFEILDAKLQGFWEGCLSVPGLRGFVERPRQLRVRYLNEKAEPQEMLVQDFLATVVQHELDHLWGKLYIDRITDTRLLAFQEEFMQFHSTSPTMED